MKINKVIQRAPAVRRQRKNQNVLELINPEITCIGHVTITIKARVEIHGLITKIIYKLSKLTSLEFIFSKF